MVMSDRIAVMNNGRVIQIGPPMEVYKHPKTAFVAGFLGETNMISCRIEETAGGHVSVRMDNGRAGSVMISRHSATPPAGGTALLSVRPERIAVLDRSDQADFAVSAIVTQHIFVGKHSRMVVEALGTTFVIITGDAEGIEVGREVCIGWMSRDAQLLEA